MDDDQLDRARDELRDASDVADRPIQTQVDSLQEGLKEEAHGDRTQAEPDPKADHVAEVASKLDALAEEADTPAADRIRRARDHLHGFLEGRD